MGALAKEVSDALANANNSHYSFGMINASCHRISDRDIARARHEGRASFDDAQEETRTSTGSNACDDRAHQSFRQHADAGHGCGTHRASQAASPAEG